MTCHSVCVNCGNDPLQVSQGILINKKASLGSEILSIVERIPQLEKESRRTPPKNLVEAKAKVEAAKRDLVKLQSVLINKANEWLEVCAVLKDEPKLWSMRVNAYLAWNVQTQNFIKA